MPRSTPELLKALRCEYPIICAPMAGVSGGRLASACTIAGGFGFIGCGYNSALQLREEIQVAELELERAHCSRVSVQPNHDDTTGPPAETMLPIGVGFITWALRDRPEALDVALDASPLALWFSFGDYLPYATLAKRRNPNILIFVQLDSVNEAIKVAKEGIADVLVLQGLEAGGHGPKDGTTTFCLVPETICRMEEDMINSKAPFLLAAGGIVNWRQLAGALSLGAHGVVVGTRLSSAHESLLPPKSKLSLIAAKEGGASTHTTNRVDQLRDIPWDFSRYTARALKNSKLDSPEITSEEYQSSVKDVGSDLRAVFAGMGVGMITQQGSAQDIIMDLVQGYYYNHIQKHQRKAWVPRVKL